MEKAKSFARNFPGRRFWCADPISVDSIKTVLSNASNPLADVQQFWRSTGNGMSQRRKQLALCNPDQSPPNTSSSQRDAGSNCLPRFASRSIPAESTSDSLSDAISESIRRRRDLSDAKVSGSNCQTDTGKAAARPSLDNSEPKSDFKSQNSPDGLYYYQLAVHSPLHTTAHTELGSDDSFKEQVNIRNKVAQFAISAYPDNVRNTTLRNQAKPKSNGRERAKETLLSLAVLDDDRIDGVLEESRRGQEKTLERLRLEKGSNSSTSEYYVQLGKEAVSRLCPGSPSRDSPTSEGYVQIGKETINQSSNKLPSRSDSWGHIGQNVEQAEQMAEHPMSLAMESVETISPFLSSTQLEQKAVSIVHEDESTLQRNGLQPHFQQRFPSLHNSYTTKGDEKPTGPPRLRHQPKFPSPLRQTHENISKTEIAGFLTGKELPAHMTHDVPRSPYSTAPFRQPNPYQSLAQNPSQTSTSNLNSTEGATRKAVSKAPFQRPPLTHASPKDDHFSIPRKPLPRSLQAGIVAGTPPSKDQQALHQINPTILQPSTSPFLPPHPPPATPASLRHATALAGILHNIATAKNNKRLGKKTYRPYRPQSARAQASHSQHWMSLRRTRLWRRKAASAKPVGKRLESVEEIGLEPLDPFSPFTCNFPSSDMALDFKTGPVSRLALKEKPARSIHVASPLSHLDYSLVETFDFDRSYFAYRHHARRRLLQIDSDRWPEAMKGKRRLTLGWQMSAVERVS
ncbi:MAG: hypothetical protein Q9214_001978 [Letrouitia sp. 1 TL-2023]